MTLPLKLQYNHYNHASTREHSYFLSVVVQRITNALSLFVFPHFGDLLGQLLCPLEPVRKKPLN